MKRVYDIDIKPDLSGEAIPGSFRWTQKEPGTIQYFIWGAGPSAIETITIREFNTDPDTTIQKAHRTIQRHAPTKLLPKSRRFF